MKLLSVVSGNYWCSVSVFAGDAAKDFELDHMTTGESVTFPDSFILDPIFTIRGDHTAISKNLFKRDMIL